MDDREHTSGCVYLVGAGPGEPELVTVRGMRLLRTCDVVVYDDLVPDELIAALPEGVERHYVGKKAGKHKCSQEEINGLLIHLAQAGKAVVRLKGGDPFIFGRGGEEAQALAEHGIPFEIVPGVTSGIAAPAFAGIPCTDRRKASSVTFVTGHKSVGEESADVPWDWIGQAPSGTLVIYMGVGEIENIVSRLLNSGMPPDTPAAAIERGTFPTQRVICADLRELPEQVRQQGIRPPAVFVIGATVSLHDTLHWIKDRPLFGVRILVTRPADQALPLYRSLRGLGAEVQPFATIATVTATDEEGWRVFDRIDRERRWLLFTSENGVRYFLEHWRARRGDIRALAAYKIAAIGGRTVGALQDNMLSADLVLGQAKEASPADQLASLLASSPAVVVRVRGSSSDSTTEETLTRKGIDVVPLTVYKTHALVWPDEVKEKLTAYPPDLALFTSGPAVTALSASLSDDQRRQILARTGIVTIGPAASNAVRALGLSVALETGTRTISGMVRELVAFWQANRTGIISSLPPRA
ncbi:MAG: uroporphyrinogen-III C-methyltransferase [Candidatus Zixiibacteriota bacterium]